LCFPTFTGGLCPAAIGGSQRTATGAGADNARWPDPRKGDQVRDLPQCLAGGSAAGAGGHECGLIWSDCKYVASATATPATHR